MKYEIEFKFETGTTIEVEAQSVEEARERAMKELIDAGVDRLPEMFPEDFTIERVLLDGQEVRAPEVRWAKVDDQWYVKVPRELHAETGSQVVVRRANGTISEVVLGSVFVTTDESRLFNVGKRVGGKRGKNSYGG